MISPKLLNAVDSFGRALIDPSPAPNGMPCTAYTYADGVATDTLDPVDGVTGTAHDSRGRIIGGYRGQVVKSVSSDVGYSTAPDPAWTFSDLALDRESAYDVCVYSVTGLSGRDWQSDYSVSGGTLALAADPTDTPLGANWYNLGSVTVPASTSGPTIPYHGGGSALGAIVLVEKVSNT